MSYNFDDTLINRKNKVGNTCKLVANQAINYREGIV